MRKPLSPESRRKFRFYEKAVQTPDVHAAFFAQVFRELRGRDARSLREDFCGTFRISCEWVRRDARNRAWGVDLDREPLSYGQETHLRRMSPAARKRLRLLVQDVRKPTRMKSDLVVACNFSFNVFKKWDDLVAYLSAARRSLVRDGVLLLEIAGGPGMIERTRESKSVKKGGKKWFTYVWEQRRFDPITHEAMYAIHFRLPDGTVNRDAFVYDWRLWTIPELRLALREAGFGGSAVFWEERDREGRESGVYVRSETGENDYAWVAYVAGMR